MNKEDKLLTDHDIANLFNVSVSTVRGWRQHGTGPPYFKQGNLVRYDRTSAERYMRTRQRGVKRMRQIEIGLTRRETRRYSMLRAINALATRNWKEAEFEREVSIATAEQLRKEPQGVFVPMDILTRDLTVGTDADGGFLKGTTHLAGSFIEALRNKAVVVQAGATILDDLVGDVSLPKLSSGPDTYWVPESGAITESTPTFASVTMAPKTLGAMVDISRKLRLQSAPSVDMLIQDDLATVIAIEVDRAALHGSGSSNQPTGVVATSGIGSVAGGTNGLAPAWSHILQLEQEVATGNADVGALSYITNTKVRAKLKEVFTNTVYGEIPVFAMDGTVNGYPSHITNQVASDLDKGTSTGVCSAIFFGNWNDLLIGQWGALDINVDTSTGSSSGTVRVVALLDVDIAVRHAESFAAMLDALTA